MSSSLPPSSSSLPRSALRNHGTLVACGSGSGGGGIVELRYFEDITEGDLVKLVNDSGVPKVKKVAPASGLNLGVEETLFSASEIKCCYDSVNDVVIFFYTNSLSDSYAVVGTVSGGVLTIGTPVLLVAGTINRTSINLFFLKSNTANFTI